MLRLSAELELPIRPDSWFLGPIDFAGETQEYVDRVFRVAELVGQGLKPPPEQQRAWQIARRELPASRRTRGAPTGTGWW